MDVNAAREALKDLTDDDIRNRIKMLENNMRQFKLENNKLKQDATRVNE